MNREHINQDDMPDDQKELDILNHSTSHVMASAIKKLFPGVKFAIGPSIKNGFYYDFDLETPIAPEDLKMIEKEMDRIVRQNLKFEKSELSKDAAVLFFKDNPYKLELIGDITDEKVTIYTTGDFVDLCAGPHIDSTAKVGAFKLLSIAGAYWRGSEKNKMLTRIYGTAFHSKEELRNYLDAIEKAKRSDHRI
jgi:threonyl-tRNA synthetase